MVQMLDDISKRKGRDVGDDDLLLLSDDDEQVRHVFQVCCFSILMFLANLLLARFTFALRLASARVLIDFTYVVNFALSQQY